MSTQLVKVSLDHQIALKLQKELPSLPLMSSIYVGELLQAYCRQESNDFGEMGLISPLPTINGTYVTQQKSKKK